MCVCVFSSIICENSSDLSKDSHVPGRFLHDIHPNRGALRVFFGSSSARITNLGFYKIPDLRPRKRERSLSFFAAIFPDHPHRLPFDTDRHSVCSHCPIVASFSYCLLLPRLHSLYQSGKFLCPGSLFYKNMTLVLKS